MNKEDDREIEEMELNPDDKKSIVEGRVMCEHILGVYDNGLGCDVIIVSEDNKPELAVKNSIDFYEFKYCPKCGAKLST